METTVLKCDNCKIPISPVQISCTYCGYPLAGNQKEKTAFIKQQIRDKTTLRRAGKYQRRSSYILYIIGAFQIVTGGLNYHNYKAREEFIVYAFIGLLFMVFGYFSSKKPLLFISLGLGLTLLMYVVNFILNPASITQGILWKLVIVGNLSYTLISSYQEFKIKTKNKSL